MLNSERIVGYNTYNNILENKKSKQTFADNNSDFYNVTVNFVMQRKSNAAKEGGKQSVAQKELPISVYENSIVEAEKVNQEIKMQAEQEAESSNEPKVIMPNEIKLP